MIEEEIRKLEELLMSPEARKSEDVLMNVLAADFCEIVASGHKYSREQIIEALLNEEPEPLSMRDFQVKALAENIVLATYRAIHGNPDGQHSSSLRSSIWQHVDNRWQIIFHQGTAVDE